nr:FCD domain-containing protein [Pseudomonas oleovorans]
MGDHDQGHALAGQLLDHRQHLVDQLRVERRGDLVAQQHLGRHGQGAGDGHAKALGLVSVQAGKGVFVQEPTRAEVAGAFAWPFAAQVSAADTFQLRFALEGFACGLAAGVMTAEVLDILEDNVEQMRRELRAGDFEQANRLDFEFHQRILAASGNQAMFALVTSGAEIFLESQKLPFIRPERAQETWQEHRKILKALARHAAGPAQKAMQQHIRSAALRTGIAFITLGD